MKIGFNLLILLGLLILIISQGCSTNQGVSQNDEAVYDTVKWDEDVPSDDFDTSKYFEEGNEDLEVEGLDT